ncbi:MAG: glycosyltransferase [bacterium]
MKVSIIIPTFDRSDALLEVLAALSKQSFKDFEALVIDDGSYGHCANKKITEDFCQLTIKYIYQSNAGPAAARNLGLRNTAEQSEIVIFIGDDIIPHPDLIKQHVDFHFKYPEKKYAILGLTLWEESVRDQFMDFLAPYGPQFNYSGKKSGDECDFRYLHTCNISFKKKLLQDIYFDEDFKIAAFEDTEFGYRLQKDRGFTIIYNPDAIGYHKHKYNRKQFIERQKKASLWAHVFVAKHQEAEPLVIKRWNKNLLYFAVWCCFSPLYLIRSILPTQLEKKVYRYYNLAFFELLFGWNYFINKK